MSFFVRLLYKLRVPLTVFADMKNLMNEIMNSGHIEEKSFKKSVLLVTIIRSFSYPLS